MNVIHLEHIADKRELSLDTTNWDLLDRTPPRPRHAGKPVQQMQPCPCPDIFGHGALQMAGKLRDKGFGCHAVAARGETG